MNEQSTHVLLIEDNPGDADLVRLRLVEGKAAVDVNCVKRLSDALDSLKESSPSVILLDLNLPDSQGAETFRKVLENAPNVPVVILSGQDDEELAMKALHQGVQDYLVKGAFSSGSLDRAMRYAVERQALLRSLEMSRKQQLEFKNQFLSHVSHELRTPLTCIHQFVTILLDGLAGEVRPEQRGHLKTILKSVNQLGAMVRDLLEASRAESGKIRIEPRCVAIEDLIRQAVAMMQPVAEQKEVGLEVGVDTRIPFVHGDPGRILEVLINLIDNGIKFTPQGGAVTVRACLVQTDPDFVYISVADTGCGIAPEARALIFERLYQDPNAVDNSRKGLGLGLFIAKELITLHGGRIWVASEPGHGSTFSFTLPRYSLAKLLLPVLTYGEKLRENIVLVKVVLRPLKTPVRANWKDICQRCLEILQRCVYLDKDLVLPPMTSAAAEEIFLVVASTDLQRSEIMMTRIREQLGKVADLKGAGELEVSAQAVPLPEAGACATLQDQVQEIADWVSDIVGKLLAGKQDSTEQP
ncbi:MAG TPA: hybrid sensor histidine kinase/response regulator [Candidatus Sulfotelmatobacter sp.]|nr:hybrid sensor histidine kinase/response regulator [Candidatus Sulfotelmatobacter sp.]